MLPSFLSLTFPIALLVAVLLVAGRLNSDMEVTALKASGVSPLRLLRPFVLAGVGGHAGLRRPHPLRGAARQWRLPQQLFRFSSRAAATGIKERIFTAPSASSPSTCRMSAPSQVALKGLIVSDERKPSSRGSSSPVRAAPVRRGEQSHHPPLPRTGRSAETDTSDGRRARFTDFSLYDMNLPLESPSPDRQGGEAGARLAAERASHPGRGPRRPGTAGGA
jgi:lipopolysaccharide export system permease protein